MSLTILSGIKPSLDVLMTLKYERYSAFMYPLVWCLGMVCVCLSGSVDAALSLGGKVSISPEFEGPVKLERVVSYYTDSDNSRVLDDFRNGDYRDQFVALEKSSHSWAMRITPIGWHFSSTMLQEVIPSLLSSTLRTTFPCLMKLISTSFVSTRIRQPSPPCKTPFGEQN